MEKSCTYKHLWTISYIYGENFELQNMSHNCNVLIKTQYFILKLDKLSHLVLYKQRHLAFISICIVTLEDISPCSAEYRFIFFCKHCRSRSDGFIRSHLFGILSAFTVFHSAYISNAAS